MNKSTTKGNFLVPTPPDWNLGSTTSSRARSNHRNVIHYSARSVPTTTIPKGENPRRHGNHHQQQNHLHHHHHQQQQQHQQQKQSRKQHQPIGYENESLSRDNHKNDTNDRQNGGIPSSSMLLLKEQHLKLVDEYNNDAYDLVWNKKEFEKGIEKLQRVLKLQEAAFNTKYKKEIAFTYNFIGTAIWLSKKDHHLAIKYFCECQRIFARSCGNNCKKALQIVNERITIILREELDMSERTVTYFHRTLKNAIDHEIKAYQYKQQEGCSIRAKDEAKKAREKFEQLKTYVSSLSPSSSSSFTSPSSSSSLTGIPASSPRSTTSSKSSSHSITSSKSQDHVQQTTKFTFNSPRYRNDTGKPVSSSPSTASSKSYSPRITNRNSKEQAQKTKNFQFNSPKFNINRAEI